MADEWCSPWWLERIAVLTEVFADGIPDDFLSLPAVQDCGLTVNNQAAANSQLEEMVGANLGIDWPHWLIESHTDVTHLYHLFRAGVLSSDRSWTAPRPTVIEFGGGSGSTARFTQAIPLKPHHIIIDTPVMLDLQEHFLAQHGIPTVRHWKGCDGAVTLCDSTWLDALAVSIDNEPDVFLGTFSVSECTTACHDWLIEHDWLGARTVLLAMQPSSDLFPDGAPLYERLRAEPEWAEEPTAFPPAVYLVRRR